MIKKIVNIAPICLLIVSSLLLSACAGKSVKANADEAAKVEPVGDITRPPKLVTGSDRGVAEETNPSETISYDEWRRRREAELNSQAE